jgi:tRNA (guanosine-2'-O-)-methyltransferase
LVSSLLVALKPSIDAYATTADDRKHSFPNTTTNAPLEETDNSWLDLAGGGGGDGIVAEEEETSLQRRRQELLRGYASRKQAGFYAVLEAPAILSNVAGVLRSCDAFGVLELLLISSSSVALDLNAPEVLKLSVSANRWVPIRRFPDAAACSRYLSERCFVPPTRCYGTAVHSGKSRTLYEVDFVGESRKDEDDGDGIAIWFGNEASGLSAAALNLCETHVFLPMLGMVESLNLSVCFGCVLSEVRRQRAASGRDYALPVDHQLRLIDELDAARRRRKETERGTSAASKGAGSSIRDSW